MKVVTSLCGSFLHHKVLYASPQEQIQKCLMGLRKEREEIQEIQSRENKRIQVLLVGLHPPQALSLPPESEATEQTDLEMF